MNELKFDEITLTDTSSVAEKKKNWLTSLKIMKERLKLRSGEEGSEGIREMKLYHGLKQVSSTPLVGDFSDICFCNISQEYLALDAGLAIHRFSIQGKPIQPPYVLSSSMAFSKLMWCQEKSFFFGYIPHEDLIWILTINCKLKQIIRNEFFIENLFYVSYSDEIIVIGSTKTTRFNLRRMDQPLDCSQTINLLDSTVGPNWKIDCSSLISHEPEYLRLVGSYLTTIYLIPLYLEKDEDKSFPVKFIAKKINASVGLITALLFYSTSQWIISGDQYGNGWNLNLEVVMSCLNGHKGAIKSIAFHPSICGFITSSQDNILQVWSCNLRDKVESFIDLGQISGMVTNKEASSFATFSGKLNCFHMHQLYIFFSPLTSSSTKLFSTTCFIHPTRIIVSSNDNTISILSSASGKRLNAQIIPSDSKIIDLAYGEITGKIYALMEKQILISSVKSRPMEIIQQDAWVNDEKKITCLVVFDCFEELRNDIRKPLKPRVIYPICTRIIVGTSNGELISIEENSGIHQNTYLAHNGPVKKLHASLKSKQIVSIGVDRCVKIWKMYPNIEKCLALLDSVYFTVLITDIVCMRSTVYIVSSSDSSQFHQLFMYDTLQRVQILHHQLKNHTEKILGIASLESLELCATSSLDRSIRIWDSQNDLLKILQVNVCAMHMTFSSLQGDIVFNAGKHLYRIPFENYLSHKYRNLILSDEITEEIDEDIILDDAKENNLNENEKYALHPVSSVPFGSLDPAADVPRLDLMLQEQSCLQLKLRDKDILQIKNGTSEHKKMLKRKAEMSIEDWEKHLDDAIGVTKKTEDNIPSHNIWDSIKRNSNFIKVPNKPSEEIDTFKVLDGFIPNSSIVKLVEKIYDESLPSTSLVQSQETLTETRIKYIYPKLNEPVKENDSLLTAALFDDTDNNVD